MRFTSTFANLLALLSLGMAVQAAYVLHEKRSRTPPGWSLVRKYGDSEILPLRFGLKQSNMDRLDEMLFDISHPESPNFGNHWSPDRVIDTFAPSTETIDSVRNWLYDEGFDASRVLIAPTKVWIQVNATVEEAERLLQTQYNVYSHVGGQNHVACDAYHLPEHVSPHVELVTPSIHFDAILNKRDDTTVPTKRMNLGDPDVGMHPKTTGSVATLLTELKNCDQMITPICIRALYGLFHQPLAGAKNSFAVVEYTPQAYIQSDLDMFNAMFSPDLVGQSPTLVSIAGGVVQNTQLGFAYNGESDLDLEYTMNLVNPIGYSQKVTLYQVGDPVQGGSFNTLLDALDGSYCTFEGGDDPTYDPIYPDPNGYNRQDCGTVKPANVIATSYAYNEADLSPSYMERQCAEYAKLGLMGVTVVYASGDNGVAGNGNLCLDVNGNQTPNGQIFNPTFPSTCPYVTSIGATQINPGATVADPEVACNQVIFSGGGFSNVFDMPTYQQQAVQNYLLNYKPSSVTSAMFNAGGRAYPDISANGANYVTAVDSQFVLVYGTSASAQVVASLLTMVNDVRLFLGKSPIGFINPSIYSEVFTGAFNDITQGNNPGCGTDGFTAAAGWDPVTGLGTPSFLKLLIRWLILP